MPSDLPLVEVVIAAPSGEVWRALRDPELIVRWFGWDAESLAEEVKFIFESGATPEEDRRVLQFGEWEGKTDRFEVIDQGDRALLRMVRAGEAPDGGWDARFDDVVNGWIAFAQQLRFAIERHGLAPRRTVFLSGEPKAGGVLAREALGLASGRVEGPDGVLAAAPWARSTHQTSVEIADWGPGLLLAMDQPPGGKRPRGVSSVILTTYGLDDAAFVALEQAWRDWWADRFDPLTPAPAEVSVETH